MTMTLQSMPANSASPNKPNYRSSKSKTLNRPTEMSLGSDSDDTNTDSHITSQGSLTSTEKSTLLAAFDLERLTQLEVLDRTCASLLQRSKQSLERKIALLPGFYKDVNVRFLMECDYDPKVVQRRLMEDKMKEVREEVEKEKRPRMKRDIDTAFVQNSLASNKKSKSASRPTVHEPLRQKSIKRQTSNRSTQPSISPTTRPPTSAFTFLLTNTGKMGQDTAKEQSKLRQLRGELDRHDLPEETKKALERRFLEIFETDLIGAKSKDEAEVGDVEKGVRRLRI